MGNKKVAYFDSDGGAIKEMNGSEVEFITETLLADFNSSDTGTGTVSVNPSSTTGLTLIGTFTDTARPGSNTPGTHPVGTTINSIATFNYCSLHPSAFLLLHMLLLCHSFFPL